MPQAIASCPDKAAQDAAKKVRYADRKHLIAEGKASANPAVQAAARQLESDNIAVERAKLSGHVYNSHLKPPPAAPEGWSQLQGDELKNMGLTEKDLIDPQTGFKAAIYQSGFEDPPKTIVAFAGTEGEWGDIKADLTQGIGLETEQYNQAARLTSKVAGRKGPGNVETTGHSLGGGLAAMGSVQANVKATTFNAAGLSPRTAKRIGIEPETFAARAQNITAYNSANDPLNAAQDMGGLIKGGLIGASMYFGGPEAALLSAALLDENILPAALGRRDVIPPAPANAFSWLDKIRHPVKSLLTGHGGSQVVQNIEWRKNTNGNVIAGSASPSP